MKKILMSMVTLAALSTGGTMAQSLPAGFTVSTGVNYVQSTANHSNDTAANTVSLGYDYSKYVGTEVVFGGSWSNDHQKASQSAMIDFKLGTPVSLGTVNVKPYALVGTGYGFNQNRNNETNTAAIYNVGAGVVVPVNNKVDVDVRYTYVDTYNDTRRGANTVGVNVAYKF